MPPLSNEDLAKFRTTLENRSADLDAEIRDGRDRRETTERYEKIASDTPDAGDASVGTEQVDLRSAQIDRDAVELQQVKDALGRIDDGTYGMCVDCGQEIEVARLQANPSAERCLRCQTLYEKRYATNPPPSM